MTSGYDFGYQWNFTHIHLIPFVLFGAITAAGIRWRWRRWITALAAMAALWGLCGFAITQLVFVPNSPMPLPTGRFLASGAGRVADLGAGSGRASLMVLLTRPKSTVVGLDRFAQNYGIVGNSPARFLANMKVAGVQDRAEVQTGDMREMPFPEDSFDAAVSSFAIDHLSREGEKQALAETSRILKPGGEFLLMVINRDIWVRIAYPFLHGHGYFGMMPARQRWIGLVEAAGFDMVEDGTIPGTLYILARAK